MMDRKPVKIICKVVYENDYEYEFETKKFDSISNPVLKLAQVLECDEKILTYEKRLEQLRYQVMKLKNCEGV